MKTLKSYMITGIIFVCIIGTLMHFVYEWSGENIFVGLFAPVNESIWEHLKLIFFPMLIFSLCKNKKIKTQYPCIDSAMAFSVLIGMFLIVGLFYVYSGILGFNLSLIDIATFYISVFTSFYIAYKLTLSCKVNQHKTFLKIFLAIVVIAFIVFTFFPPQIALFISP